MKICLVGGAPSSRMLAPYGDPSWEIWAGSMNNAGVLPRVDKWFELHGNLSWPEDQKELTPYIDWLNKQTFELWAQDNSILKNAKTFPIEEMVRIFGAYVWTSTWAYMLAYAIVQKPTDIAVFGIDMAADDEYLKQRPAFQMLLVLAQNRGIRVLVPPESDILCPPPMYGYLESTDKGRKMRVRRLELEGKIANIEREERDIQWHKAFLKGALADLEWHETNYLGYEAPQGHPRVHLVVDRDKVKPPPLGDVKNG